MKQLTKSKENKTLSGVLGGIGEYYDVDPVIIRLAFLIILLCTGIVPGLIVYLIAILIVPDAPVIAPVQPAADDAEPV